MFAHALLIQADAVLQMFIFRQGANERANRFRIVNGCGSDHPEHCRTAGNNMQSHVEYWCGAAKTCTLFSKQESQLLPVATQARCEVASHDVACGLLSGGQAHPQGLFVPPVSRSASATHLGW